MRKNLDAECILEKKILMSANHEHKYLKVQGTADIFIKPTKKELLQLLFFFLTKCSFSVPLGGKQS